jgi:hypothetical protein
MADQQKPPTGHRVIRDGKPKQGLTSMGFKGPGGRPADQPPNNPAGNGKNIERA